MHLASSCGDASPPKQPRVFAAMDVLTGVADSEQNWGGDSAHSASSIALSSGGAADERRSGGGGGCSDGAPWQEIDPWSDEDGNGAFEGVPGGLEDGGAAAGAMAASPRGVVEGAALFDGTVEDEKRNLTPAQIAPMRPARGYGRHYHLGKDQTYAIAGFSLLFFAAVALTVFLTSGRGEDAAVSHFRPPFDHPVQPHKTPPYYDFAAYGYPHVQETMGSAGWVSWPKDARGEYAAKSFFLADEGEDADTPEACARSCRRREAPAGAFSVKYGTCWCNTVVELGRLCREPCVADHYVDFSARPIAELGYCEKSVCDKEWYHSVEYCEEDVEFDEKKCEGTLASIMAGENAEQPTGENAEQPTQEDEKQPPGENAEHPTQDEHQGKHKVSDYYPHMHKAASVGWVGTVSWVSWYPALEDGKYIQLDESDGVTSLEDCAAECHHAGAPSGGWNVMHGLCFCVHKVVDDLCWEPCVLDEVVNFATEAIAWLAYCEKSVCQGEWDGRAGYCKEDVQFDKEKCDDKLSDLAKEFEELEATSSTEVPETDGSEDATEAPDDPSTYGYPHIHKTAYVNWVSWSNALEDESYALYTAEDGVASVGQCAAKCQETNAPTGAWKALHGYCFCIAKAVDDLCWEPCAKGEYVNFATDPITWLSYCDKSVCEDKWYASEHDEWHRCAEGEYDQEACNAKLAELAADDATWSATSSTTASVSLEGDGDEGR